MAHIPVSGLSRCGLCVSWPGAIGRSELIRCMGASFLTSRMAEVSRENIMQQTHSADLRRKSLALAVVMALCGTAALNASAATSSASSYTTVAHTTLLRQGDAVLGALPMTQPIHVVVALKLRNKAVLDAFVADNAKNQSGGKSAQLMSSAQILANHAPTQQQAQAVASYLSGIGFSNVTIAPNRMLVSADGTAATARNAFMTSFAQVRTRDGRIAFANTDDVRVPASLGEEVLAVIGLQNVHLAHADAARSDRAHTDAVILHDPTDFASIYGGTGVAPASSVIVGILTNASGGTGGQLGQDITDLNTFATNHSLSAITTSVVDVNGAGGSTPGNDVLDVTSQDIVGIVGGQVKKLIFYNIPSTSDADLTAGLNEVVSQNLTKIIDVSYGVCETDAQSDGSAAADDTILEAGVAQGQTFAVSTGSPGGADQCGNDTNTPLWPASSQYVIAVTGTLLNASSTTWSSEQVYNGSGGSASTFEPMPSWQTSFGVSGTTRAAADVAFDSYPSSGSRTAQPLRLAETPSPLRCSPGPGRACCRPEARASALRDRSCTPCPQPPSTTSPSATTAEARPASATRPALVTTSLAAAEAWSSAMRLRTALGWATSHRSRISLTRQVGLR